MMKTVIRTRCVCQISTVYLSFFSIELSIFYFQFGIHSLIELLPELKKHNQMIRTLKLNGIKGGKNKRETLQLQFKDYFFLFLTETLAKMSDLIDENST